MLVDTCDETQKEIPVGSEPARAQQTNCKFSNYFFIHWIRNAHRVWVCGSMCSELRHGKSPWPFPKATTEAEQSAHTCGPLAPVSRGDNSESTHFRENASWMKLGMSARTKSVVRGVESRSGSLALSSTVLSRGRIIPWLHLCSPPPVSFAFFRSQAMKYGKYIFMSSRSLRLVLPVPTHPSGMLCASLWYVSGGR